MGRWPTLSITRDEQGRTLQIEWPLRTRGRRSERARLRQWLHVWMWLFLSAFVADLGKLCLWLLIANWGNRLPDTDATDRALVVACFIIAATPLILSVTLRALYRHWRALFPKDPVRSWVLPEASLFREQPPDEPPELKGCGVPVGPRHPAPLEASARPELVAV